MSNKKNSTKFYLFTQNFSDGIMMVNDNISGFVLIEAENDIEANKIAQEKGIYFDGVEKGIDCPCCGDRWDKVTDWDKYRIFDTLSNFKKHYNDDYFEKYRRIYNDEFNGKKVLIIHFKNGKKEAL